MQDYAAFDQEDSRPQSVIECFFRYFEILQNLFFELTFLPAPTFGLPPAFLLSPVKIPGR